jgi:HD-GYP domain-containing protein (c-di-GMP phosphodiesterase class II)
VQAARDEILAWSGRQFDPAVVNVFLSIPPVVWSDLHRQIDSEDEHFSYSEHLPSGQS